MNWTRYKLLIISGAITLVICGVLIFWILSGASTAQELQASIQSLEGRQNQLTAATPYPSEENLKALGEEQQKVRDRRDAIETTIREGQVTAQRVDRSLFGDYIRRVVPAMRRAAEAATKGGEDGVILADPDFGMTEFLEGTLPSQKRIDTLVVEIETMEHVANLLFDSGISELKSIAVEESNETPERAPRMGGGPGGSPGSSPMGGPPGMGRPGQAGQEEDARSEVEEETERLFEAMTVEVEFSAYEDFLWATLNNLLADSNQIAVSSMSVTNSNTILWPDYLKSPSGSTATPRRRSARPAQERRTAQDDLLSLLGGGSTETAAEQAQSEEKKAGLEERQQYLVGGDLLTVVMELKVFRLKTEEDTTQPEGA
jgi:hypothetical protein